MASSVSMQMGKTELFKEERNFLPSPHKSALESCRSFGSDMLKTEYAEEKLH